MIVCRRTAKVDSEGDGVVFCGNCGIHVVVVKTEFFPLGVVVVCVFS